MKYIDHIRNPQRLLLVWQGVESPRVRRAVAELVQQPGSGGRVVFRYLVNTPDFAAAVQEGFVSFPAFRKTDHSYDLGVVETFMRRLPPSRRGDYAKYLEQFRVRPESKVSDMALLAYTGAKLPSDGYSIIDPLENVTAPCDLMIEVAGFRHNSLIPAADLAIGARAELREEPDNPHDANAMAIYVGVHHIGYVLRQQARALREMASQDAIELTVERVNGQPQRPLVYLFAQLRPPVAALDLLEG